MEQKPVHYDGSGQLNINLEKTTAEETLQMTDEIRKNIGGNPFGVER